MVSFWFARQAPITPQAEQTRPLAPSLTATDRARTTTRSAARHPYWRGTGSLVTGIAGAGLASTSCWAVSSPALAAARVTASGDRG